MAEAVDDDEIEALEPANRVAASDVGAETVGRLESAVDDLATGYTSTLPAELLARTRRYLSYGTRLLGPGVRKTLAEHRQLVVVSAWLSLLAATLHIDLKQRKAAEARPETAVSLARHAGHREIGAWVYETRAWEVLTEGDYPRSADRDGGPAAFGVNRVGVERFPSAASGSDADSQQ